MKMGLCVLWSVVFFMVASVFFLLGVSLEREKIALKETFTSSEARLQVQAAKQSLEIGELKAMVRALEIELAFVSDRVKFYMDRRDQDQLIAAEISQFISRNEKWFKKYAAEQEISPALVMAIAGRLKAQKILRSQELVGKK